LFLEWFVSVVCFVFRIVWSVWYLLFLELFVQCGILELFGQCGILIKQFLNQTYHTDQTILKTKHTTLTKQF
jgi:hypothetical protein